MNQDVERALARVTGFKWDEGNTPKVLGRHGVEPGECEQAFFGFPFIVSFDAKHLGHEQRWHALGKTGPGRHLFVVFTLRGSSIRVLAARDMNRKERSVYATSAQAIADSDL